MAGTQVLLHPWEEDLFRCEEIEKHLMLRPLADSAAIAITTSLAYCYTDHPLSIFSALA